MVEAALRPDKTILEDSLSLRDEILNLDVENYVDELDGVGPNAFTKFARSFVPVSGDIVATILTNNALAKIPFLQNYTPGKEFLKGMNYAVKAANQADDVLYGVAKLSNLQRAKIAGINFVRFIAEETIQNAIMAGL